MTIACCLVKCSMFSAFGQCFLSQVASGTIVETLTWLQCSVKPRSERNVPTCLPQDTYVVE